MQLDALGCAGAIVQGSRTSAYLLDSCVLLDAGTGVGSLKLEAMLAIDHIFISHAHFDHIAALPLMLDTVMATRQRMGKPPILVYALEATIESLRRNIFNREIWPDFSCLPNCEEPVMRFVPVRVGEVLNLLTQHQHQIEVLPAVHSVPAVGFAVRRQAQTASLVYTGDTGLNPALWRRLVQMEVAGLIIEAAFNDAELLVAKAALHLTPSLLSQELENIPAWANYPIFVVHTKPAESALIAEQVRAWGASEASQWARHIQFLRSGERLDLGQF